MKILELKIESIVELSARPVDKTLNHQKQEKKTDPIEPELEQHTEPKPKYLPHFASL